jgi:hypothetical protein
MERRIEIGRVCRLQIQLSSLKAGPPRERRYDPSPLRDVPELWVDIDGVSAKVDGVQRLDVHNATHPDSKNRAAANGVSIGFTSHYRRMRDRFNRQLPDGIAGENILVEADGEIRLVDLSCGVEIEAADGRTVALDALSVAHPCVEFSRFAMGNPHAPATAVSETLRFLDDGLRGYYARFESTRPARVAVGDRVYAVGPSTIAREGRADANA